MLQLLALLALSQTPQHRLFLQPNMSRANLAYFELAPLNGAGMTPACACQPVTGAKGETISLVRATTATCSKKGAARTGIQNGDYVECAANQFRVEPDATGVMGLRTNTSRTNSQTRTKEFTDAAWPVCTFGTPLGVTRIANQAIAPDGTLTADRLIYSSTTSGQSSCIFQVNDTDGVTTTRSVFVKSFMDAGTFDICSGGIATQCIVSSNCQHNPDTWTLCEYTLSSAAQNNTIFGCDGTTKGAACVGGDVYIWGGQTEAGWRATSYIPTVASAATRDADYYTAPLSISQMRMCMAVTATGLYQNGAEQVMLQTSETLDGGNSLRFGITNTASVETFTIVGSASVSFSGGTLPSSGARFRFRFDGDAGTASIFATPPSTGGGGTGPYASNLDSGVVLGIGTTTLSSLQYDGILSRIQVDPTLTTCTTQ